MKKSITIVLTIILLAGCAGPKYGCPSQQWLIGKGGYTTKPFKVK